MININFHLVLVLIFADGEANPSPSRKPPVGRSNRLCEAKQGVFRIAGSTIDPLHAIEVHSFLLEAFALRDDIIALRRPKRAMGIGSKFQALGHFSYAILEASEEGQ